MFQLSGVHCSSKRPYTVGLSMVAEDHEVILTAAKQNPRAIRHAGKALRNIGVGIISIAIPQGSFFTYGRIWQKAIF